MTLPNGKTYDLSDYNQRTQARQDNPGYVVDSSGYLLRGSGGAPSSDPSRGGSGNDNGTGSGRESMPAIEGGIGTANPGGYVGVPITQQTQVSLAQAVAAAANNLIPAGSGGSNILAIAQQLAGGVSLQQAISAVTGSSLPGPNPPATYLAPNAPTSAQQPVGSMRGPVVPTSSGVGGLSGNALLIGGAVLLGVLVLRR